ncbi:MAG: hypothetical protein P8184_11735, partial [Calditrichia bacterium]
HPRINRRKDILHIWVIALGDDQPVSRHSANEFSESILDLVDITVNVRMIKFDVVDNQIVGEIV